MSPQRAGALAVIGSEGSGSLTDVETPIYNLIENGIRGNVLVDQGPAINALIASVPVDSWLYIPSKTAISIGTALQLTNTVHFKGQGISNSGFRLLAGFSDVQLIRWWQSTDYQASRSASVGVTNGSNVVTDAACSAGDAGKVIEAGQGFPAGATVGVVTAGVSYTVLLGVGGTAANFLGNSGTITLVIGETNKSLAPLTTAKPVYYGQMRELFLDANGISGVQLLARVHPQERALVDRVMYLNTGGVGTEANTARADFANLDAFGSLAGVSRTRGEISYNKGWAHMINVDGTNGQKLVAGLPRTFSDSCYFSDVTTAGSADDGTIYSDNPIQVIGAAKAIVEDVHSEGFPNSNSGVNSTVFTDGVTNSTNVVSSVQFAMSLLQGNAVGRLISDASGDIPAGAYVTGYNPANPTQLIISAAATGSHSANAITLQSDKASVRFIDVVLPIVDDFLLSPGGGVAGGIVRPAFRNTASINPANTASPIGSMSLRNIRLNPTGTSGSFAWASGAPIIEDFGSGGSLRLLKASTFDPRVIFYYDGSNYAWEDGASGTPKISGFPSTPDATAYNDLLGWSLDPGACAASGVVLPAAATLYLCRIPLYQTTKITNVLFNLTAVGAGTLTHCFIALFQSNGTFVGQTADQATTWGTGGSTGDDTRAFQGGPFTLSPLAAGDFVWLAFYVGTTTGGALPAFSAGKAGAAFLNNGATAARSRFGSIAQADTATLASIVPGSVVAALNSFWVGIN